MNKDDLMLKDQVAVVTGGGGGIGAGIALKLAEYGAHVVVVDIIAERAEDVAGKIRQIGRRSLAIAADVMDTDQIGSFIARTETEFGRLDILVNNAGGTSHRLFLDQTERNWRRHIDINFISMIAATSAAAPVMIKGGRGGSIVNIASIEGQRAAPGYAIYAACKAGMLSFTRTMALELSEHGIRVNAISPDHTVTPGMRGNRQGLVDESQWYKMSEKMQWAMNRIIPLGREGHVDECGNAAVFLSSRMAEYITGINLNVDGGTWASSGWLRDPEGRWTLSDGLQDIPV